jgi:SWIM zinc finger
MQQIQVVRKQSRYSKGSVIAASRQILKVHGEDSWLVESETIDDKFYKVTGDGTCDCMDFQTRGGPCKHMWALIRRVIA